MKTTDDNALTPAGEAKPSAARVVTEGWRLVPEQPTFAMLCAAIDIDPFKLGDISPLGFRMSPQQMFERAYKAMLAASPTPSERHGNGGEG